MTKLCPKGLHEMTPENTRQRDGRIRCRLCENARRRASYVPVSAKPPSARPRIQSGKAYRYEHWTDEDGRYYLRLEAELFEYTEAELYLKQGRKRMRDELAEYHIDPALIAGTLIEVVEYETDIANPHWTTALTLRTVHPVLAEEAKAG